MAASERNAGKLLVRGALALGVSAVALWWAFRDVPLDEISKRIGDTDPWAFALYFTAMLVTHLIRVPRWGLLVLPVKKVSHRAVASAALVGLPAAVFLPLRLGELVRPAMLARAGVPFPAGMASVVVERVADGLFSVGLFFLLLVLMPTSAPLPDELRTLAQGALVFFGGACVGLVVSASARSTSIRLLRRVIEPISKPLAEKVITLFATFLDGVSPLANPKRFVIFAALTVLYWAIAGAALTVFARSFGLEMPWIAGPFTLTVVVFAVMIPAGPAFAGTLEVGMRLGLTPFAVSPVQGALVAIVVHIAQLASLAVAAGLGFLVAEEAQKTGLPVPPPES